MSLLEQFDKKSARQRASFLVLLSDRLECDEFIVQLGEYIGNVPKLVQKVFLFFFHSTLHAKLDETKHAFNSSAMRISENLITKASSFFATNWKFITNIKRLLKKGQPFAFFGTETVPKFSLSVFNQVFFKHIHQKIFQHSIFQRYIRSI